MAAGFAPRSQLRAPRVCAPSGPISLPPPCHLPWERLSFYRHSARGGDRAQPAQGPFSPGETLSCGLEAPHGADICAPSFSRPPCPGGSELGKRRLKASGSTQPELQAKSKPITKANQTGQRSRVPASGAPVSEPDPADAAHAGLGQSAQGSRDPHVLGGRSRAPVSALSSQWLGRPLTPPPSLTGGMRGLLLHAALRHRSHGVWRKTHKVLSKNRLPLWK